MPQRHDLLSQHIETMGCGCTGRTATALVAQSTAAPANVQGYQQRQQANAAGWELPAAMSRRLPHAAATSAWHALCIHQACALLGPIVQVILIVAARIAEPVVNGSQGQHCAADRR